MASFNNDKHYLLGVAGIVVTVASIVGVIQKSYILLKEKEKKEFFGSFDTDINVFYLLQNEWRGSSL